MTPQPGLMPVTCWGKDILVPAETYSFIVRLWFEQTDNDDRSTAWRGSIDWVGHPGRIYFTDLDRIADFIQTQLGLNHTSSLPEPATRIDHEPE